MSNKKENVEQQEETQEQEQGAGEQQQQQERAVRVLITHLPTKVVYELPQMGEQSGVGMTNKFMSADKMGDPLQFETKRGELISLGSKAVSDSTISVELAQ